MKHLREIRKSKHFKEVISKEKELSDSLFFSLAEQLSEITIYSPLLMKTIKQIAYYNNIKIDFNELYKYSLIVYSKGQNQENIKELLRDKYNISNFKGIEIFKEKKESLLNINCTDNFKAYNNIINPSKENSILVMNKLKEHLIKKLKINNTEELNNLFLKARNDGNLRCKLRSRNDLSSLEAKSITLRSLAFYILGDKNWFHQALYEYDNNLKAG